MVVPRNASTLLKGACRVQPPSQQKVFFVKKFLRAPSLLPSFHSSSLSLAICSLGLMYCVLIWQIKNEINKCLKQMGF